MYGTTPPVEALTTDELTIEPHDAVDYSEEAPLEEQPLATEIIGDLVRHTFSKPEELGAPLLDTDKPSATISASVFNLSNTMVGAGTISLPYAVRCTGIVGGLGMLLLAGWFAKYSIDLLLLGSVISGQLSYDGIGRAAFGIRGHKGVQIVEVVNTIGALASYLVLIADQASSLAGAAAGLTDICTEQAGLLNRDFLLFVILMVLILPLAMQRKINNLRYPSLLGLICLLYLGILVIVKFFIRAGDAAPMCTPVWFNWGVSWFQGIPIMSLSYTCHINVMHIYRELKDRKPETMQQVTRFSLWTVIVFYGLVATFGYAQFCDETKGDILRSYGLYDASMIIARIGILGALSFSYPIICFPCRSALQHLLFDPEKEKPAWLTPWRLHAILTVVILGLTFLIAIFVPGVEVLCSKSIHLTLQDIFSLVGAITATALVYVMPSLFYNKLSGCPPKWWRGGELKRVVAWTILVIGTVLGVISTVVVIASWGDDDVCDH